MMKYGEFDDERCEYVIRTPLTPNPWINYLGTEEFYSLISHTGGGFCFYRDPRLRRLLRYRYNNIPNDSNGRYFYLVEGDDYWSLGYMPTRQDLDRFECRHGLGYTRITGERRGISASLLAFVPLGHTAEIHQVTLQNNSDRKRTVRMFSFLEFCLWNAYDDANNLQRNLSMGEVEVDGSTIYHLTEYRERRNHFAFYHANRPLQGFDTQRESFLGTYGDLSAPSVVREGASNNSLASGWSPIASHCLEINLDPGEKQEVVFTLGYVENSPEKKWLDDGSVNKQTAQKVFDSFATSEQVESSFQDLADYWNDLLGHFQTRSSDDRLDRMVNIWNAYQCMITFNISRSASYFETGIGRGMGFRDCNQDLLGVVHMVPDRVRQRLIDLATTQFSDGSAYHQYQPLTKRGNHNIGSGFNDDPLWLILAACEYLKETGDYALLDLNVPFDHNWDIAVPMLEHLDRSFQHVVNNLGPHQLPLIGRADWNDCLNLNCHSTNPDESFQTAPTTEARIAESVLIAGMFVYIGREYIALLRHRGLVDRAQEAQQHVDRMVQAVIAHGYDGDWFLRAYDAAGNKVGSAENLEGQIYIEPQGFCCMAEIGHELGYCQSALESVGERLATEHGIALLAPTYSRYDLALGEISSYPAGYKENGSIFCHNNPWIMIAEAIRGRGDRAFDYYTRLAPAYRENHAQLHRTEPYIYAQMIAGPGAQHEGEAKNSWLTGTASWNYVAITQFMLGVKATYDGLRVKPADNLPLKQFSITRKCRGAEYLIEVRCAENDERPGVVVDGEPLCGDVVPYQSAGSQVHILCLTRSCN